MARVGMNVGNQLGRLRSIGVCADATSLSWSDVDELTCGFPAEWSKKESVWRDSPGIRTYGVDRRGKQRRVQIKSWRDRRVSRGGREGGKERVKRAMNGCSSHHTSLRLKDRRQIQERQAMRCRSKTRRWRGSSPGRACHEKCVS